MDSLYGTANSNTTPVTVQHSHFHESRGNPGIQIQHLLLFNETVNLLVISDNRTFKYNTCYCSTCTSIVKHIAILYSNTTPVTVQRLHAGGNTALLITNSNTTPVTVQLIGSVKTIPYFSFKYNTCYCSTTWCYCTVWRRLIQIQHLLLFNPGDRRRKRFAEVFKYNTCYCSTAKYRE